MKRFFLQIFLVLGLFLASQVTVLAAGAKLTLTPSTSNPAVGEEFTVTVGVYSGGEASAAVDIWGAIPDTSKMELVKIDKAENPAFSFEMIPSEGYQSSGKFNVACVSDSSTNVGDKPLNGNLVVLTLKAKAKGWAYIRFDCSPGLTTDSNIFNSATQDIIQCDLNSSGQYNIGGSDADPTPVPPTSTSDSSSSNTSTTNNSTTTTSNSTSTTSTSEDDDEVLTSTGGTTTKTSNTKATTTKVAGSTSELPRTGATEVTFGLIIFGVISLLSAIFLKFL